MHIWRGAQDQPPSLNRPLMWRESPPVQERSRLEVERQEVEAAQRQVDERDARQFAREARRRESAAVSKYGMAAYHREDIRRDERGRILR